MHIAVKKASTGFIVGILSGLLGVGGGVFMVPLMVSWFGFNQHIAQATSLAMIIPTALFGSIVYSMHGSVDFRIAAFLAVGSIVSAMLGAYVMIHMPAKQLKAIFGVMLVLVGIRMVLP